MLLRPNEKALLARAENDGGGGRDASAAVAEADWNIGAVARFLGKSSSSSGSRSWSTDDGNVEVELYRADAEEESYRKPLTPEFVVLPLPLWNLSALWISTAQSPAVRTYSLPRLDSLQTAHELAAEASCTGAVGSIERSARVFSRLRHENWSCPVSR